MKEPYGRWKPSRGARPSIVPTCLTRRLRFAARTSGGVEPANGRVRVKSYECVSRKVHAMHYPASLLTILVLASSGCGAENRGQSWEIRGQVVDEQGVPVEDFEAASFWSSNGKQWDE